MKFDKEFEKDWRDMKKYQYDDFDPLPWVLVIAAVFILMLVIV